MNQNIDSAIAKHLVTHNAVNMVISEMNNNSDVLRAVSKILTGESAVESTALSLAQICNFRKDFWESIVPMMNLGHEDVMDEFNQQSDENKERNSLNHEHEHPIVVFSHNDDYLLVSANYRQVCISDGMKLPEFILHRITKGRGNRICSLGGLVGMYDLQKAINNIMS